MHVLTQGFQMHISEIPSVIVALKIFKNKVEEALQNSVKYFSTLRLKEQIKILRKTYTFIYFLKVCIFLKRLPELLE